MPPLSIPSGLTSAAGNVSGSTPDYGDLRKKYGDFAAPMAKILLQKKELAAKKDAVPFAISDIHVEATSGYEASVASFHIYNAYSNKENSFRYDELKSQLFLGATAEIQLGYGKTLTTVFVGYVAGVAFCYEPGNLPYIEVSAMDVKSMMMGGTYSCQLAAHSYGAAVREIFTRSPYQSLKGMGGITDISGIKDTPDKKEDEARKQEKAPLTQTIEMVAESDYEFVVKAAKKFNFEFFIDRGKVMFRPAKADTTPQARLGISAGIVGFHTEYSLTGLVGSVEARAVDPGKGTLIKSQEKVETTLSTSSKAQKLIGKTTKVYVDPTIASKEQADARVASLKETMSYRLGALDADCVGLPDLVPGRCLEVHGMGAPADNVFYITSVEHEFTSEKGFSTKLKGCAAEVKPDGLS